MNDWTGNDEVTTTAGSIWLAQRQAYNAGVTDERARLLKVLEDDTNPIWFGQLQPAFIALVKGEQE